MKEAEEAIKSLDSSPDISFAIVDSKNMEILGNIALALREENRKSAEIMYWLAPWGRGRGIATKSVQLLCQWAFDFFGLERITLQTHRENIRSQLVAKRAGFQMVGSENQIESNTNRLWFELENRS